MANFPLRNVFLATALAFGLAGCTSAGQIVMKNPRTYQVVICSGHQANAFDPYRSSEKCAEALEGDGWKRLGSDAR